MRTTTRWRVSSFDACIRTGTIASGLDAGISKGSMPRPRLEFRHLFLRQLLRQLQQRLDRRGVLQPGDATLLHNRPISVYRFPRRAPTHCLQVCMGLQPAPAFPHLALSLCTQLHLGISPGDIPKSANSAQDCNFLTGTLVAVVCHQ